MPEDKTARIARLTDQCVQCGLCLPVCPTYALDRREPESPRGRIALAAALARGEPVSAALREPLDHCLGCLNCEAVCPAQVRFGDLLVETRALTGPAPRRPNLLLALLRRPAWLRRLRQLPTGLARLLPARSAWRRAARLRNPARDTVRPLRAHALAGAEIALFPGCVGAVEDARAGHAAQRLLRAAGYRVAVLPAFCCGAMDRHGGRTAAAEAAADQTRAAWRAAGARHLVTVTPGCLGTLRSALPGVPVEDPWALLVARMDRLHFRPRAGRFALHVPCTQANVAGSGGPLLTLLARVPGLEVVPLQAGCCGAAGSHVLEFPERADRLREPLLQQIAALAPAACLSSNIGCRLHLAAGLRERDARTPTMHPLTLLAEQLTTPEPA